MLGKCYPGGGKECLFFNHNVTCSKQTQSDGQTFASRFIDSLKMELVILSSIFDKKY